VRTHPLVRVAAVVVVEGMASGPGETTVRSR
jgi:hypothetical protein